MKILAVLPSLAHGGAEGTLLALLHEWSATEDVSLVVFEKGRHNRQSPAYPVVDLGVPSSRSRLIRAVNVLRRGWKLSRIRRNSRPDVIVAFQGAIFSVLAAQTLGGPGRVITSIRTNPYRYGTGLLWLLRRALGLADGGVVASTEIAAALESPRGPGNQGSISVIPNPVRHLQAEPPAGGRVPEGRYLLHVGRMYDVKNQQMMIEAFRRLRSTESAHRDVRLVLIGEGPDLEANRRLVLDCGLEEHVDFPGFVSDPGPWLRQCEAFVLTSRFEGWPNALAEAVTMGCRIISVDCDYGPREILAGYPKATLVPLGDIDGLVDSLDAALQKRAENHSEQQIPCCWQPSIVAAEWLDLFRGLCAR